MKSKRPNRQTIIAFESPALRQRMIFKSFLNRCFRYSTFFLVGPPKWALTLYKYIRKDFRTNTKHITFAVCIAFCNWNSVMVCWNDGTRIMPKQANPLRIAQNPKAFPSQLVSLSLFSVAHSFSAAFGTLYTLNDLEHCE